LPTNAKIKQLAIRQMERELLERRAIKVKRDQQWKRQRTYVKERNNNLEDV